MTMPVRSPPDHNDGFAESCEQTPLLSEAPNPSGSHAHRTSSIHSRADAVPALQRPGVIITMLYIIVFVTSASGGFQNISMTRIFEDILCRQYYNRSDSEPIDEDMCKINIIQSKLAYLFAIQASFNAGASILTALPWGVAADKIGRRPVFAIGLTGMGMALLWIMVVGWFYQTLSPRLIWLSPISFLLGGGHPVLVATLTSMVVDVVPESERSASFIRIHGASMVGNLISPALASALMASTGPWPPMILAFLLITLPAFAIFLVPESLKHKRRNNNELGSATFKADLAQSFNELRNSANIFSSTSMIIILLITMLQLSLVLSTLQFLSQFASKRYHIPLADTGYIQSTYGAVFIAVSFFIMPFVSSVVLKPGAPAFLRFHNDKQRDLSFARTSYLASMVATFILGLAGSLPIFILGLTILAFGVSSEGFLKSIATLFVTAEQRSRLFTILGLAAIASDLWVSPALAALFSLGMRLGGIWIGLPYFGLSAICVLMFSMALFLNLPASPTADEESDFNRRSDME